MNLHHRIIDEEFDYIVSLGSFCPTAYHIRRYFGYDKANVFDWWVTPTISLIELFENGLSDLFIEKNMTIVKEDAGPAVMCSKYGIMHYHDFDNAKIEGDIDPLLVKASLDNNISKFNYLTKRLLDLKGKVLFIRFGDGYVQHYEKTVGFDTALLYRFFDAIEKLLPNIDFKLLLLSGYQGVMDSRLYMDNVHSYDKEAWHGGDQGWDEMFSRQKIRLSNATDISNLSAKQETTNNKRSTIVTSKTIPKKTKTIAIISNCQGQSLELCMRNMNPSLQVDFIDIAQIRAGAYNLLNILDYYDLILTQKFIIEELPSGYEDKTYLFPNLFFSAFHPDMSFLEGQAYNGKTKRIESLMSIYHSSIAIFGFLNNIPLDQILTFYNPYVYSRLGYIDRWQKDKALLLQEAEAIGMPINVLFGKWAKRGVFMHSFNHPDIYAMEDIATIVMDKLNIEIQNKNCSRYLDDPFRKMPVWPIYPEIAIRYGFEGDYSFKRYEPFGTVSLREFVEEAYANYSNFSKDTLVPLHFNMSEFNQLLGFSDTTNTRVSSVHPLSNPYEKVPDYQFWNKALTTLAVDNVDPVTSPKFTVNKSQKIATAGSCFAQHIARTLSKNGFNYFVSETASRELDQETAKAKNYGVFSARYGNIYTVRQLVQLVDRAYGKYQPEDTFWMNRDNQIVDPFRPQIEPNGFENISIAEASRQEHFARVRNMLEEMDVFVFTLGLTEGWRSRHDGAVFPLAPGVAGGKMDSERYEFINFSVDDIVTDFEKFIARLSVINPSCKIILTVSPVPLIATYEHQHALVATTYSKAVLRVAAEEIKKRHQHVEYFPSYEIIAGSYNKGMYFEDDLRSVTEDGVAHVMRLFLKHYMVESSAIESSDNSISHNVIKNDVGKKKKKTLFDIVCDEESIAKF